MARVKEKYDRRKAERRFARLNETIEGDQCTDCGMPNDRRFDHQLPVYVIHRFADGGVITKKAIWEKFGKCRLVPCCYGLEGCDRR